MKAIFKGAGQDLSVKLYRYEFPQGIIILFVSRNISPFLLSGLWVFHDQVYGDIIMLSGLFLQPQRLKSAVAISHPLDFFVRPNLS